MRNALLILLGLAAIGGLTYFCANDHRPMIEADLTSRTQQALSQSGFLNAKTEAEGQIITLRGQVASEEEKSRAGAQAASVWGVSEVRNLLEVKQQTAAVMPPAERAAAVNCQATFKTLLAEPISFDTGSAVIHPSSYPLLNNLARAASTCPAAFIEIGGHTDSRGAKAMNMKLSQARAEAVAAYLTSHGVDRKRLSETGYGPTKPVASNATPQGMEQNRRIEFTVKGI